jgi:hypothetical protein
MWPLVVEAAKVLGAVSVTLKTELPAIITGDSGPTFSHTSPETEPAGTVFRAEFAVPGGIKTVERVLSLGWVDGRDGLDRDTEIAAEVFCEHLGEALDSVKGSTALRLPVPRALPPS